MTAGAEPDAAGPPGRGGRAWRRLAIVVVVVGTALQLVPLGAWQHDNPPVVDPARFADPAAEEIARASCFDCHSHEVRYPPQAWVAPVSWLVRRDVVEGRDELNFSDFDPDDAEDAAEAVLDGEMPPRRYVLAHPGARLTDEEVDVLVTALSRMAEQDDR